MTETEKPEVCEHGSLKRQCLVCELHAELAAVKAELAAVKAERDGHARVLTAITKWLEENQNDVWRRGIWDTIHKARKGE